LHAQLSIILPTLNSARSLGATLESLRPGGGIIREVIVSDGGSKDETSDCAKIFGARFISGDPGRGGQLGRGAALACGAWLLFVHSDTRLETDWHKSVQEHITAFPDRAGCFRLRFQSAGVMPPIVATWANMRTRLFGLPYGDQGLLVPRTLYDYVGGYEDIPLMEDVAIARALGGRIRLMKSHALTNPDKFDRNGWIRQGARNFGTLARYLLGASPEKLAQRYEK